MRKAFLALLIGLVSPSAAHGALLINADGSAVGGKWQQWIAKSKVPTYQGQIQFGTLDCGGPAACSTGLQVTRGRYTISTGPPFQITVTPTALAGIDRGNLYFELGHVFDAADLTPPDRRYLARGWGRPRWHWWNTPASLALGGEDGLEAIFAFIYEDCAMGINDQNASLGLYEPWGVNAPNVISTIDTCARIRAVVGR